MLTLLLRSWTALSQQFADWRRRQQAYAELAALDDRSLADIGISRSDIPYLLSGDRQDRKPTRPASRSSLRHAA